MKNRWFVLKRNATVHHILPVSKSIVVDLYNLIGISFEKHVCIFKDGEQVDWNYDVKGINSVAKFMLNHSDKEFNDQIEKKWKIYADKLEKIFRRIDSLNFNNISDAKLLSIYKELIKVFEAESAYGTLSDFLSSELIPKILAKHFRNLGIKKGDITEKINIATISIFKSPYTKEQEELFKIAVKYKKSKNITDELLNHSKKYWYLQNDYKDSKKLAPNYFMVQILNFKKSKVNPQDEYNNLHLKVKSLVIEKKKVVAFAKSKKNLALFNLLNMIDVHVKLWDLKKVMMQKTFYYLDLVLKEIAARVDLSFKDIKWCLPDEVELIFQGSKIESNILSQRKKLCVLEVSRKHIKIHVASKAKKIIEEIEKHLPKETDGIKGQIGNSGKVVGRVKIIFNPKENKILSKGEILVTGMTTPDFIPLMKKASAFITDEGGITCHAAIVAREMNKPCIIGTRIATKVLHDGDFVEVDADKGLVKILKRK
jgi:phosphoenolpyruvate synthase/pyruvate phosphate dikinase